MSGSSAWIRALTQPGTMGGEDLLRLWAEEDRQTQARETPPASAPQQPWQRTGADEATAFRLTDTDIDRVAQALCRRLLDAAGNM